MALTTPNRPADRYHLTPPNGEVEVGYIECLLVTWLIQFRGIGMSIPLAVRPSPSPTFSSIAVSLVVVVVVSIHQILIHLIVFNAEFCLLQC